MFNKSIIQGRLTSDVELKQTHSGKSVCSFTVATERNYIANNERITDFIPCVAWGNTAEFISKHFNKGAKIIVEGLLTSRRFADKNGNNRTVIELSVEKSYFDGTKGYKAEQPSQQKFEEVAPNEDLPF